MSGSPCFSLLDFVLLHCTKKRSLFELAPICVGLVLLPL
jgi:hypothetical protein